MSVREQTIEPQVCALPVVWPRRTLVATVGRLFVAALAVVTVGVSLWLVPSPTGPGTHEQLHLPPCGFKVITGLPCPSCGMTTAFAYIARLEVAEGFSAQPFGALMFLGVVAAGLAGLWCAVFNRSILDMGARLFTVRRAIIVVVVFVLVWGVQILRAFPAR